MKLKQRLRRASSAIGMMPAAAAIGPDRDRADEARARREWTAAAQHYHDHLKRHPSDAGIWVQRGHMLKEAGRLIEAIQCYRRAVRLRPRDADVLLHLGHLQHLRGDPADAAKLYGRAADIEMVPGLAAEMASPDIRPLLSDDHKLAIDAYTAGSLGLVGTGIAILETSGMVALGHGRVALTDADPWVHLRPQGLAPDTVLAEFKLVLRHEPDRPAPRGRLYLDFADGWTESHVVELPLSQRDDGGLEARVVLVRPARLRMIRWDPDDQPNVIVVDRLSLTAVPDVERVLVEAGAGYPEDIDVAPAVAEARQLLADPDIGARDVMKLVRLLGSDRLGLEVDYALWNRRWTDPSPEDYARIAKITDGFAWKPTFSFVMPVYNTPVALLVECLEALLGQTYPHFEVCIADDNSPDPAVRAVLDRYAATDPRLKVVHRPNNGHISAASNSALALATGEFVVLVDHDDLIPDYCLFVVAHYLNLHPEARILFSDEDKISIDGERFAPYFKGEFDRFLLYGHNMVSHLGVYRRDLIEQIGGFRLGLEGSQDYDLLLRAVERVGEDAIVHIPHVLYHWRAIPGSTALSADQKSYAILAAQGAINAHFTRTASPLLSVEGWAPGNTAVTRTRNLETSVSIIIPTRDGVDLLRPCVDSILERDHRNTEILIVDNGSSEPEALAYLAELSQAGVARVIDHAAPFNFSEINNVAAREATGDILCFLNNDTEVVSKDWIDRARVLLSLDDVGVVGARLLYPDGTLQHFGVTVGTAEHRVAAHPHCGQPAGAGGYFSKARLMQQFSAVTAACLFITREAFDIAGGFDPDLRVAYNDVDLCLKVRRAGLKIVGDPDIVLVHKESRTRGSDADGDEARRLDSEANLMRARWGKTLEHDRFYSPNLNLRSDFTLANPPRVQMPWRGKELTSGAREDLTS